MGAPGLPAEPIELRRLLDENRPASALRLLPDQVPAELAIFQGEALIKLDRYQHALELLENINPHLSGDSQVYAWCLQARIEA